MLTRLPGSPRATLIRLIFFFESEETALCLSWKFCWVDFDSLHLAHQKVKKTLTISLIPCLKLIPYILDLETLLCILIPFKGTALFLGRCKNICWSSWSVEKSRYCFHYGKICLCSLKRVAVFMTCNCTFMATGLRNMDTCCFPCQENYPNKFRGKDVLDNRR